MILRKELAAVCMMNLLSSSVQAVPIPQAAIDEAQTALAADSALISGWMTNQLKYVVPFNSTSGNVVPSQLKLFGFEVGVAGVVSATKIDENGLHALPTTLVNTNSIDTFSRLPFPMILAHAKIGLPFGLDGGIRLGGIPKKSVDSGDSKGTIKNKVVGIDVRKKLIDEGALKPFGLTVGLNYTHADGSLDITNTYDSQSLAVNGGAQTVALTNGLTTEHADWKTNSVGLQAILEKKILIITPYIGASVNRNSGDIHNSITTTGVASVTGFDDENLTAVGTSTEKANKWDVRALAGFELSILPFVKLGLQGEYAGSKNVAGALGLRVQFR
jgi:hypothetical protein